MIFVLIPGVGGLITGKKHNFRVKDQFETVDGADVILVEGILIFYDPELRNMFNMKIFVDADPDIRLARRGKNKLTVSKFEFL